MENRCKIQCRRADQADCRHRSDAGSHQPDPIRRFAFPASGLQRWPEKTLIYCDPPYYAKGRDLYYDYYEHEDHERVAALVTEIVRQKWIVSYDDVKQVRDLYAESERVKYSIGYSARSSRQGAEIMFFSQSLRVPQVIGAIKQIKELRSAAKLRRTA
jgi:D12 class N6 adenine-specific DNA methyltransferase